ncbi:MAG: carbohydrate kinase family protein [Anaerolineae bacterium]|nr:carbohydrate kinase family protein [Anaerolineae bacterium]
MASKNVDVVVVGNVGIDTNVFFQSGEIDFSVEANFTENIDVLGQAGGYASRGYARLGASTAFIGCVGADFSGDYIKKVFTLEGINTEGFFIDPQGTSRSINFMYRSGKRKNFYDGKSHMHLHAPLEQAKKLFESARLAHFNIPNWARELLPVAKKAGALIACDIQDVVDVEDPYRTDFVRMADYLFFSTANHPDPAPLMHYYLQKNPSLVIISGMGERGCALGTGNSVQYFPPVTLDLPVVDTNGAGDALAVGFLTSHVLEGRSLEESVQRGQISARYKCAQRATSDCMITRDLLDHYQGG